jgi:hypothetical protein
MGNDKLDLNTITLVDHTAMDEDNWQDYSITVDASTVGPFDISDVITLSDDYKFDFSNIDLNMNTQNMDGKLSLSGEDADIVINGKSLNSVIADIEKRLNILQVNPELEAQWQELRELGDQYRELESKLLEKNKVWEKIAGSEDQ